MTLTVKSAHVGTNAEVFPFVLRLHVPLGSVVADVTYGRGTFWLNVNRSLYDLRATDLATGTDCTRLPYCDRSIDAVILDPPYVAGFFRPRKVGERYRDFTDRYSAGTHQTGPRYHAGVLDLLTRATAEAYRVLRIGGVCILKCQDEVHAGKQYLTHVEIIGRTSNFFHVKDLFVVVRNGGHFGARGRARSSKQEHARKNHSYFVVFEK